MSNKGSDRNGSLAVPVECSPEQALVRDRDGGASGGRSQTGELENERGNSPAAPPPSARVDFSAAGGGAQGLSSPTPTRTGSLRQGALGSRTTSHFYFRAKNKGCCPRGRGQAELLPARVLGGGFGRVRGNEPGDEGQPTRERRAESWKELGTAPCHGAADQLLPALHTLLRGGKQGGRSCGFSVTCRIKRGD